MKKRLSLFILIIFPFLIHSQGQTKSKIDWISLEKAEKYSKKYKTKILIYFYKPGCEFCDKMRKETLKSPEVIKLINNNFLPVKMNGYTKDTIVFNGKIYGNQQPASSGRKDWRHDFYFEYGKHNNSMIPPTIVIIDGSLRKIKQLTGYKPKTQFLREIKKFLK